MSLALKLDRIVARAEELRHLLNEGVSGDAFTKASRELSEIEPVVARVDELRQAEQAREILKEAEEDEGSQAVELRDREQRDRVTSFVP